ncbi:MAG: hypothetical protein IH628_04155 [Proteobacteria bacterium]|nr:hypothetical protein [Pseudomonadota bacterium]
MPAYRTWSSSQGDQVYQMALPIVYILPLSPAVSLDLTTAMAQTHLSDPSQTIAAFADTRVRASWVTLDNTLLVSGGVIIPTGHAELRPDERVAAASLANPVLDFPVSYYGQGAGATASLAYALELDAIVLGFGMGTYVRGSFKPSTEVDAKYRPGSEFTALVGAETSFRSGSAMWRILGDIDFTWYGADTYDDQQVFRSGNRWMFNFQTELRTRAFQALLFLQDRTKGKNERGLGSLLPEPVNTNGNQLEVILDGTFPLGQTLRLRATLESKFYADNEYGTNGATLMGGGPGLEAQIANGLWLEAMIKYFGGTLRFLNASSSISGFHSDIALRVQF